MDILDAEDIVAELFNKASWCTPGKENVYLQRNLPWKLERERHQRRVPIGHCPWTEVCASAPCSCVGRISDEDRQFS